MGAALEFLSGPLLKFALAAAAGIMLAYPIHKAIVDDLEKQIAEAKLASAQNTAAEAGQSAVAAADAAKQAADATRQIQGMFNGVTSALSDLGTSIGPAIQSLNTSFKGLSNDPQFACLYRPLPDGILNGLRIDTAPASAASH